MPPVASTTAAPAMITRCPNGVRARMPLTTPPSLTRSSAQKPSSRRIDGVLRTAATSAAMMARPAVSPFTRTMRRAECAASRDTRRWPSRSLSNGTPYARSSATRAGASRAIASATDSSTRPAPAATVSRACASGVSSCVTAAAMPPWAQALEAPSPRGAAVTMVTGRGASFSAQNRPARPPPTMITSSMRLGGVRAMCVSCTMASAPQVHHALDGAPRLVGDHGVDHDFLLHVHEAVENLWQGDALHVRAQIARPHEFDLRQLRLHVVRHGALGHHDDALRPAVAPP